MSDITENGKPAGVKPAEVTLYLTLTSLRPIAATLSSDDGLNRSFILQGTTANESRGPFREKDVRVIVAAPISQRMAAFAAEHGVESPCGNILIRKGVEPRHREEGPPDPAIQVAVAVEHDTLDRLYKTARGAIDGRKALGLSVMAASTKLSDTGWSFLLPEDLDVSEDRPYPVVAFSLTPLVTDLPDARPKRPPYERRERTTLAIRMTDMRADLSSWDMRCSKMMIGGEVIGQQPFKGISADIEIVEFEKDLDTDQFPKEAHPGAFSFYPSDQGASTSFGLALYFTPMDFERVMPLLLASRGSILEVSLNASRQEIEAARETLYGDIHSFTFGLRSGQT